MADARGLRLRDFEIAQSLQIELCLF